MQDVQNIPNPDVNSTETADDFGSHSEELPAGDDIENPDAGERGGRGDIEREDETIPVPPDVEPQPAPIEEPTDVDAPSIEEEDQNEPKRIA
jgi:hypothetical protein